MNDHEPTLNQPAGPAALPRLVVRVAVTGHRPPDAEDLHPSEGSRAIVQNDAGIRKAIQGILKEVVGITGGIAATSQGAYSKDAPVLRILSSLAEGADRMVAQDALAVKDHLVQLECPLPAARDVYRKDFKTAASQDEFDQLVQAASAVFELDGSRNGPWLHAKDYANAGHVLISNCDLVIAIWDGDRGRPGGTGTIVDEATREQVPIVWIDPRNPDSIRVSNGREWARDWQNELKNCVLRSHEPPKPPDKAQSASEWLRRYAGERIRANADESRRPDELAKRYGFFYRFSYRLKYLLAALAVLFAVLGLTIETQHEWLWPGLELGSIGGILLCFGLAWAGRWHERWLDYRLLAEQFRVLRFLRPLGKTVPVFHPPKYWEAPPARHSCVRWYFRARLREFHLPDEVVTSQYVRKQVKDIQVVTEEQFDYNTMKYKGWELGYHFTEWTGFALFAVTAAACLAHVQQWGPKLLLGALTATLPALGAAMEGLQAQEEGKRLAGRCEAMAKHLRQVEKRIEQLPRDPELAAVAEIAFDLATEMTWETSGWHNLLLGQPPRI